MLVAESCQLSMVANKFHWIYQFTLEYAIFMLEDSWGVVQNSGPEDLAFDILEMFWFHSSQVQPILQFKEDDFLASHGKLGMGVMYPLIRSNFDQKLFYKASQKALAAPIALKICRKRIWDLASMAQRKHGDIPAILEIVESSSNPSTFAHRGHEDCTPEFCEFADENSTIKKQLHKCLKQSCRPMNFPVGKLAKVINDGRTIAWKVVTRAGWLMSPALIDDGGLDENNNACASKTLAISHVWSDGTGVGVQRPGMVNKCLAEFFFAVATDLGCSGLWWDTICVPTAKNDKEKKARSVAISKMHQNYANAKHTLIHDEYLLKINWAEDGSPAIALVLSPWFSRGWTALELSVSRSVKVLYRDPEHPSSHVLKDLDNDILAKPPFGRLGHVVASALIRKLRGRPSTLMDLLTILSTRSTSWNRDRMAIAALFARIKDFNYNSSRGKATRQILEEYQIFDRSLLHHGQATIVDEGPFSWCPSNLLLNSQELLTHWNPLVGEASAQVRLCPDPQEYGSVLGSWYYVVLNEDTVHEVKPLAKHLNAYKMLDEVLPECLLVLLSESPQLPDILVLTTGMWSEKQGEACYVDCHYAGSVWTKLSDDRDLAISERRWSREKHYFKLGTSPGKKPRPVKLFIQKTKILEDITVEEI